MTTTFRLPSATRTLLAALAVLVIVAVWDEVASQMQIAHPGGAVQVARNAAAVRLNEFERECAARAEGALSLAAVTTDPAALSSALSALDPWARGGVEIFDGSGAPVAWAGHARSSEAPAEAGSSLLGVPGRLELVVVRTAATTAGSLRSVCHRILNASLTDPTADSGLVRTLAERFAVQRMLVEAPGPTTPAEELVRTADGSPLARVVVEPLEREAWVESRATGKKRTRQRTLLALVLVGLATLWVQGRSLAVERRVPHGWVTVLRGAGVGLGWFAFEWIDWRTVLGEGPLTSAEAYAGEFGDSALGLLVRCAAAAVLAGLLRVDLRHRRPAPWAVPLAVLALLVVAQGCRVGLEALVVDVVENSTVVFFPEDAVLPRSAGAVLLAAVALAGLAALDLVRATTHLVALDRRVHGAAGALTAVVFGALVAPSGPLALPELWVVALTGALSFGFALLVLVRAKSVVVRVALVPMLLALGAQAPLQRALTADQLDRVATAAEQPAEEVRDLALLRADAALAQIRQSPALERALAGGALPDDLAWTLWTGCGLSLDDTGSGIVLRPTDLGASVQVAGSLLPPESWLPNASVLDAAGQSATASLPGRGSGMHGRWAVGRARLVGPRGEVGVLDLFLEWRRPYRSRQPALELLAQRAPTDTRSDPAITVVRYDTEGTRIDGSSPARTPGLVPDRAVVADVARTGFPRTLQAPEGDRTVGLLVRVVPETEDDPVIEAISFEAAGVWDVSIAAAKALLAGAALALLGLLVSAWVWWPRLRRRLANRVVVLLALVSAAPLLSLAWVAQGQVFARAASASDRALRESVTLTDVALRQRFGPSLEGLEHAPTRDAVLRSLAHGMGHHVGVYAGTGDARLLAASDAGLVTSDLLPRRLPAAAHRECVLRERPFVAVARTIAEERFEVGFAPVLDAAGQRVAVLAVPYPDVRRARDRELAGAVTAVLGISLLTLVAAVGAGSWLSRRLTAPLRDLTVATHRVVAGDLTQPVPGAGADELGQVVDAFNRMLADLDESQRKLVSAEKEAAWRDMARQVAHEVKNPLTPMRLAAQHLERAHADGAKDFDQILARAVAVIVRQTDKLQRIVTAFRDFARLPEVRREPVDVGALVAHVLDLYARVPGLRRSVEVADGLPPVSADPEEFERVLINLVGNAVEAHAGADGSVTARVSAADGAVSIEIEDDGPGIPTEALPRLFEPSFSTKTGGTGLGLAICKRAIEDLGGTIAIESHEGDGTTVSIRLPTVS